MSTAILERLPAGAKGLDEPPRLSPGLPRDVSTVFSVTVDALLEELPDGPELTKALNAMLEAKDWAVRAAILLPPQTGGPA